MHKYQKEVTPGVAIGDSMKTVSIGRNATVELMVVTVDIV